MIELDTILDSDPTDDNVGQMVRADALNRLAFVELEHYEKNKTFKGDHPIVSKYKLLNRLNSLLHSDPVKFMNEVTNANKGISRYQSLIKNEKYKSVEERVQWEELIKGFAQKLEIMQNLISK